MVQGGTPPPSVLKSQQACSSVATINTVRLHMDDKLKAGLQGCDSDPQMHVSVHLLWSLNLLLRYRDLLQASQDEMFQSSK